MARRDEETTLRLQNQINTLIRANQLNAVQCENRTQKTGTKKWWENVNNITRRKDKNLPISSLIDANEINAYFQNININPNYSAPVPLQIPEGTRIPLLSTCEVYGFLRKQKHSSSGPDDLPHWFWKTYAAELALAITEIFNVSLQLGLVPDFWKRANVVPIPKETVCPQLRPISLTDVIMRLFERCV